MPSILLADDEAPLRTLLRRFLEARGFTVWEANDGLAALRIGNELLNTLDLLIADIRMPGMEGTEVARHLKETRPDLKVLLISGFTDGRSLREPFLAKPFAPAALLHKVTELLGLPGADAHTAQTRGK
jgi:two-component system cell cycle sensor histidine kinase/response regulator CckA